MIQLTGEQVEEIQVLESIYGDAFRRKFDLLARLTFILYL